MGNKIYIPHQLDKNRDHFECVECKRQIYIPHQLDKNLLTDFIGLAWVNTFTFLIS